MPRGVYQRTEAHRFALRNAHLGKPGNAKGYKRSAEEKLRISLALKGRPAPNKGKRSTFAPFKKCTKCGQIKPITEYAYEQKREIYSARCRECVSAQKREYSAKNKDKVRQWKKREYNKDSSSYKVRASKNYYSNKQHILFRIHNYYQKNKGTIIARITDWRNRHPEKRSAYAHKRRLKIENVFFKVTKKDLNRQLERQNFECFWCHNKSDDLTLDHVLPLSRGGKHSKGNIVFACRSCNSAKNNKYVIEFLRDSGFFGSSKGSSDKTRLLTLPGR